MYEKEVHEIKKESILNEVSALKYAEEKGKRNKAIEVAKKSIFKYMDNETIQDLTELSIEEICEIRKEVNKED